MNNFKKINIVVILVLIAALVGTVFVTSNIVEKNLREEIYQEAYDEGLEIGAAQKEEEMLSKELEACQMCYDLGLGDGYQAATNEFAENCADLGLISAREAFSLSTGHDVNWYSDNFERNYW